MVKLAEAKKEDRGIKPDEVTSIFHIIKEQGEHFEHVSLDEKLYPLNIMNSMVHTLNTDNNIAFYDKLGDLNVFSLNVGKVVQHETL